MSSSRRGLSCSIMTTAGRTARTSSASSGYCSAYSSTDGFSPALQRRANSSASSSTRLVSLECSGMVLFPVERRTGCVSCRVLPPPGSLRSRFAVGEDFPEPVEGADVALAGGVLADAQHLGHLDVTQLLEV